MRFGLKPHAGFLVGGNAALSFSSLGTAYEAIQSDFPGALDYRQAKEINMTVQKQIKEYIAAQPEPKRGEMQELHGML